MRALVSVTGTSTIKLVDRPEPQVTTDDEVKLRVLRVGICGTDREEAAGGRSKPPAGQNELVIGHEIFGQVVETGKAVTRVARDDFAVFTVRRGCGKCSVEHSLHSSARRGFKNLAARRSIPPPDPTLRKRGARTAGQLPQRPRGASAHEAGIAFCEFGTRLGGSSFRGALKRRTRNPSGRSMLEK